MGLTVYGGGGKPEEEKTVTAGTSAIVVNPSSGKVMKKVTVNPTPSQSKTVTPSTSQQTVSPDSGKLLSQVIVKAMEDVTPEVTAQTPIITQIAENLGVTITTPSGTNKQILHGNNANLLNIKDNAKKEGLYVWKKLTAQGGNFIDYVVSDQEIAYPDGGEQGGYWYEKVVEDILFDIFGCTKMIEEEFTFTSDKTSSSSSPLAIAHSLGEVPKVAILYPKAVETVPKVVNNIIRSVLFYSSEYPSRAGDVILGYTRNKGDVVITAEGYNKVTTPTSTNIYFMPSGGTLGSVKFPAGVTYELITMA